MRNSEKKLTSVLHEINEQDNTIPKQFTVVPVSLSVMLKAKNSNFALVSLWRFTMNPLSI